MLTVALLALELSTGDVAFIFNGDFVYLLMVKRHPVFIAKTKRKLL